MKRIAYAVGIILAIFIILSIGFAIGQQEPKSEPKHLSAFEVEQSQIQPSGEFWIGMSVGEAMDSAGKYATIVTHGEAKSGSNYTLVECKFPPLNGQAGQRFILTFVNDELQSVR